MIGNSWASYLLFSFCLQVSKFCIISQYGSVKDEHQLVPPNSYLLTLLLKVTAEEFWIGDDTCRNHWSYVIIPQVVLSTQYLRDGLLYRYNTGKLLPRWGPFYWRAIKTCLKYGTQRYHWQIITVAVVAVKRLRVWGCACTVCSEIQQVYRTNIVSYMLVVLNSCLSVAVGMVVWFLYEPPPFAAPTISYGIIGGLQLWIIFFANVVLLVGKASIRSSCDCECEWESEWVRIFKGAQKQKVTMRRSVT